MKILFVSTNFPTDVKTSVHGLFKRMAMFINALNGLGDMDCLFYVPRDFDCSEASIRQHETELCKHWGVEIRLFLAHRALPKNWPITLTYLRRARSIYSQLPYSLAAGPEQVAYFNRCLTRRPDLIFAHRLPAMCTVMRSKHPTPPAFLDLDDVEHVSFLRAIRQSSRWLSTSLQYLLFPALLWGERRAIRRARRTFVCSEIDVRYLSERWRLPGVAAIPNAAAFPPEQRLTQDPTLLFLGTYNYGPNIVGANHLIADIWPSILSAVPEARLVIAGQYPERIPMHAKRPPGVVFPGFVDNLNELYAKTRIVCCPILSGGGTRVKLVEAAAFGKPIVSTHLGAEGLELEPEKAIMLRDQPREFAEACVALLRDGARAQTIGAEARKTAANLYDLTTTVQRIQRLIVEGLRSETV